MAVKPRRHKGNVPPIDKTELERLALGYAGRYATTRAKLTAYLSRKLRERGWEGQDEAPVEALVERLAGLGYVDDRAFANARGAALSRRGYGMRRIGAALRAAGIGDEDAAEAHEQAREQAWSAALRFAERKRIGPFAARRHDPAEREKALGALIRAGHPIGLAQRIVRAAPGEIPQVEDE